MLVKILIFVTLSCKSLVIAQDYILNSKNCKIPNINPFNSEVQKFMFPQSYVSCNHTELLSYIEKINSSTAILHLRKDSLDDMTCSYCYVRRQGSDSKPDVGIATTKCDYLNTSIILEQEVVKVVCRNSSDEVVYENVHAPVLVKEEILHKLNKTENDLSVLFIVVDSVSRLNFIRTMSETYDFFTKNKFVQMKGYTKVADNTYPNFMSFLTGLKPDDMSVKCKCNQVGGLDVCPMIWYDYQTHGFITAYAEDYASITTFNYLKKGFTNPPTDYYFKPYVEATETLQLDDKKLVNYCTGPETAGERILNLAKDFLFTFQNHSSFGIFWMNTFSHDELNSPYKMDLKMSDFFQDLKNKGIFDKTIIVFLSDHGFRFGDIRKTKSGWFEERMPTCFVRVPEKHKELAQKLEANSNKLTSVYDLHATLQHILRLTRPDDFVVNTTPACANCRSFFEDIPEERSCTDAGIPGEWCTCGGFFSARNTFPNEFSVRELIDLAIEKINDSLNSTHCRYVMLDYIESVSVSEAFDQNTRNVFLVFKTIPSSTALVTVKINPKNITESDFYIRRITNLDFCFRRN